MTDRMSDGYQPEWDIDLAIGKQGEMLVHGIADALRDGSSIEVKTDEAAAKWGRVYVEYECLKASGWAKSGIAATEAELWAVVLGGDVVVIAPTWRWKNAVRARWRANPFWRKELKRGSHPTKGVVLPLVDLLSDLMGAERDTDPARSAS